MERATKEQQNMTTTETTKHMVYNSKEPYMRKQPYLFILAMLKSGKAELCLRFASWCKGAGKEQKEQLPALPV